METQSTRSHLDLNVDLNVNLSRHRRCTIIIKSHAIQEVYKAGVSDQATSQDLGLIIITLSNIAKDMRPQVNPKRMKFYIEVVMILGNYIGPPSNQIELCYVAGELEAFLLQ